MAWERFETIWNRIVALEGQTFRTITGLPFTYTIESGVELWAIKRDGDRINQRLSKSNFSQVYEMMQDEPISGPGEINKRAIRLGQSQCRGTTYVWAILHDERVVRQRG